MQERAASCFNTYRQISSVANTKSLILIKWDDQDYYPFYDW